jgi:hypothetical protein
MENRTELAEILLAGLPDGERQHIADVIHDVTEAKLRQLRDHEDAWTAERYDMATSEVRPKASVSGSL